jgi:glutathione peroxidase
MIDVTLKLSVTWVVLLYRKQFPMAKRTPQTIYPFTVTNIEGDAVSLASFKDKVLLIVNTASECGYTPQYKDLEELYKEYRDQGFEVLAFPSNDFGEQEPLNGAEIADYCSAHFRTTFPVFEKAAVKGENAIPLYQFLSNKKQNGHVNIAPRWNFQKYLVNRKGEVVNYYFPFTKPTSRRVKKGIEKLL